MSADPFAQLQAAADAIAALAAARTDATTALDHLDQSGVQLDGFLASIDSALVAVHGMETALVELAGVAA